MNALKELFKKLFPDKAAEIDAIQLQEDKPTTAVVPPVPAPPVVSPEVQQLQAQIDALNALLKKQEEAQTVTAQQTLAQKVTATVEDALKTGKITPEQKALWEERLNKNYDEFSTVLNELKGTPPAPDPQGKKIEIKQTGDPILDTIYRTANFVQG